MLYAFVGSNSKIHCTYVSLVLIAMSITIIYTIH